MTRLCFIKECKKQSKWFSETPVWYLCSQHAELFHDFPLQKIVNNPCKTCLSEKSDCVTEATFGPLVNGKFTRMYCKKHVPSDKNIFKKTVKKRSYA